MKKAFFVVFALLLVSVALEVGLRLLGIQPERFFRSNSDLVCSPNDYWRLDSVLGFKYNEGAFMCTANDVVEFSVTHGADGFRVTSEHPESFNELPEIHLYGCSVTWGHGLNDSETVAWKLQYSLPQFAVKNFGIGASSNAQALRLFETNVERGDAPRYAVLVYAAFHHIRNTMSWNWRRQFHIFSRQSVNNNFDEIFIPRAKLNVENEVVLEYMSSSELLHSIPKFDQSAFLYTLNEVYQKHWVDRNLNDYETSKKLILEFNEECKSENVKFIVAGLLSDPATATMLADLQTEGVLVVDMSVDLSLNQWRLKGDGHPNENANVHFAESLLPLFRQDSLGIEN
jgi:hypothetical protein